MDSGSMCYPYNQVCDAISPPHNKLPFIFFQQFTTRPLDPHIQHHADSQTQFAAKHYQLIDNTPDITASNLRAPHQEAYHPKSRVSGL